MATFRNPVNGAIKKTNSFMVLLGCLFFCPIFFILIGEWGHGIVSLLASAFLWIGGLGFLVHFIWTPFAPSIVSKKWTNKGWVKD